MTTIRDNDIYFSVPVGYQLVKGIFKVIDGSVTTDQPSNVKAGSVLSCGADGKFRFSVGRKASSTVANWFNRQVDTNSKTTFGHTASELNFAFTGHLELVLSRNNQSVACRFENVVIAQGNNGASNNWWFGGVSANSLENNRIILDGAGESHDKISITCQRGGNGLNHIDILQVFNQVAWMKKLNPSLSLKQINMVGTHDTGTYYASGVEKPWVKTQTLTTAEQLRAGIRYLDVRCHHISDTLTIHHSDWSMNLFFSDLLEDCVSFLKYNPSETIVMQVKEEHGDADQTTNTRTFYETFKVYIDRYPDMWCLNEGIPSLKEAQGKIILVRRFPLTGTSVPVSLGIDTPFKNDATFDIATPNGVLKIQDQYKFLSNEHKWSAVSALMAESSNNNQGQWFINFTSAASNTITAITQTPESIAQTINNKLVGALANYKFVGTIIMDFPDIPSIALTIEKVINKNFDNPMFS